VSVPRAIKPPTSASRPRTRARPRDPVAAFRHDHGALNDRVRALGQAVRARDRADERASAIAAQVAALRDDLFLHFAREEEGLFPFVADALPRLRRTVATMVTAHDQLCGALARIANICTRPGGELASIAAIYERFEATYAEHARREHALLEQVAAGLGTAQRTQLTVLLRGL
jgi:iron-sulfur cluster repair protein YtfE (RIC family)